MRVLERIVGWYLTRAFFVCAKSSPCTEQVDHLPLDETISKYGPFGPAPVQTMLKSYSSASTESSAELTTEVGAELLAAEPMKHLGAKILSQAGHVHAFIGPYKVLTTAFARSTLF